MEESLAALSLIGREEAACQVDLEEVSTEGVLDLSVVFGMEPLDVNNHLLFFHRLKEGEDPMDFLGQILEYDTKSLNKGYGGYMRIRVQIDVRNLFMRKKKLILSNKGCIYAHFQYEKLSTFCIKWGPIWAEYGGKLDYDISGSENIDTNRDSIKEDWPIEIGKGKKCSRSFQFSSVSSEMDLGKNTDGHSYVHDFEISASSAGQGSLMQ
ncbi:hypothetical protein Golax_019694 [Gossypium laxum]|uniref:Uncharacterized protein n=1 Tax=Gossypium laxum TaxID=34288 RepID=A0A7J8Z7E3_9ROSI|nr:hypothetical protein [Gossypium laxum]